MEKVIIDWDKRIKDYENKKSEEKKVRDERMEKAKRLEKSWEMLRWLKNEIKENTPNWEKSTEEKKELKRIFEEKSEKIEKAKKKKSEFVEKYIQKKILDCMKLLPKTKQEEFEKCEREKEKAKRKEIQEIKENLWRKWRTKKLSRKENIEKSKNKNKDENTRKIELENKLKEIEEAIEKVKSEQAEEKKKKDAKMAKLEKKRKLEKHWEMLKWITEYIDNSTPIWQEQDRRTEKEQPEDWSRISRQEKIDIIIEKEKKELTREEKIIIAKEKKSYWTEWRGKGKEHPVPSPKQRSDEVSPDTPTKMTGGLRGGGRNPVKEDAAAPPTTPNITITTGIIGYMRIGSATIRYSHCAERDRRHFQENVYRSYENSMRLGTIEEEKPLFPKYFGVRVVADMR